MLQDLRYAVRLLLQAKGWTAVVLLLLAIGIGANTALFNVVDGLLLKSVPASTPDTLVRLRWAGDNDALTNHSSYGFTRKAADGRDTSASFSYPMYRELLAANRTMTDLSASAPFGRVNVIASGAAEVARAFISSGNYYQLLGIQAEAGRLLEPNDDRADADGAAVLSHRYWLTRFGGDRRIIGQTIRVDDLPITVVGIVPPAFTGIQEAVGDPPDIGLPLALYDRLQPGPPPLNTTTFWWLAIVGRLDPGVSPAQVQANLGPTFQHTTRMGLDRYLGSMTPEERARSSNVNRGRIPALIVEPGRRGVYDPATSEVRAAAMLTAVVALVLVAVCANVANLLLARASARQKEASIRLSLGATRARLVRQSLTESVLLSTLGAALGLLVAYTATRLLPDTLGQPAPFDLHVLWYSIGVACVTGVAFGLAPALTATRISLNTALNFTGRGVIGSKRLLGKALLVTQVALALVLIVGATLFVRTTGNLRRVDVGFNPHHLLLFTIDPRLNRYEASRAAALFTSLLDDLRRVPGAEAVALSQPALLSGSTNVGGVFIQGKSYVRGEASRDRLNRVVVSPSFFDTMQMPIREGRGLTDRDTAGAPPVVVINDAAARAYFPGRTALGQRFGFSLEDPGHFEIVGVVRDVKYNSLRDPPPPTMYLPYRQTRTTGVTFEVRTASAPTAVVGAVRETVRRLDPNLPVTNVTTQLAQIENRFQQERMFAQAYSLFGVLSLLLASIGLFGLMSYAVSRRTNEIGIRLALGARRGHVLALVLGESTRLTLIGVAIGLAAVFAAGRLVAAYLFELAPTDAWSITAAMSMMLGLATLAGYVPARRASRVDPLVALRRD